MKSPLPENDATRLSLLQAGQRFPDAPPRGQPGFIKALDLHGRLQAMNECGMKVLEICDLNPFIGSLWLDFWKGSDREAARPLSRPRAPAASAGSWDFSRPCRRKRHVVRCGGQPDSETSARPAGEAPRVVARRHATEAVGAGAPGHCGRNGVGDRRRIFPFARAVRGPGARGAICFSRRDGQRSNRGRWRSGKAGSARASLTFPGTPCQRVAAGHVCAPVPACAKFPEDLWLQQIGAESYVGVPMRNAGPDDWPIAVLHTEPIEPSEEDIAALRFSRPAVARSSSESRQTKSCARHTPNSAD